MKGRFFPDIDFSKFILPPADLKIVRRNGILKVFDRLRKDYFILTEEEFVRQVFVEWLITGLGYPPSLVANEIGINLNGTAKRCDTVVFSSQGNPLIIVEYKAPSVKINAEVFDQIVRYNLVLKAKFLAVTNGYCNFFCKVDYENHKVFMIPSLPTYPNIINEVV